MNTQYDAIVMGVGAMGSAALYALASRGYNVCGIEQFDIAHANGSSHGETRLIRKAYFEHPNYILLLHGAYDEWERLNDKSGQQLFVKNGLLLSGKPNSTLMKGLNACYTQHDLPHEKLELSEAENRWSQIVIPENHELFYDPIAGYLYVEKAIRQLCRLATNAGATLFTHEKVIDWQANDDGSVTMSTDKRTLSADRLIITCGAWAADVLQTLNIKLDIWRKVLYWYNAPDLTPFRTGTFPSFFIETKEGGFYGFPAINSTGVKIGEHYHKDSVSHPDELNREVKEEEDALVSNFVSNTFPGLNTSPNNSVVCMYTMSEDEHFIIDHHPRYNQVVIATGFSGHGFKFAPIIGHILADLSIKGDTSYPIDFLRLNRFETESG